MKTILYSLFIVILLSSCDTQPPFDIETETQAILAAHHQTRDYHFNKDSIAFANQLSENFISVNRGKITSPTKESNVSRYNRYFSSVEFVKWDDVSDPIIRFSDDGSLAYTIVDKIVEVSYEDENGKTQNSSTHYAWTAIYKKYDGVWKTDCVTSTERVSE